MSDRDVIFTSSFWQELFRLSGTILCFSSAYNPQSDGQTEVVNRILEMYLRCFTSDRPKKWFEWLAWAEFCYNTSFHTSLKATPFEVVYGRQPPRLISYTPGQARLEAVDHTLQQRDFLLHQTRERLTNARNVMKFNYDKKHREVDFTEGDLLLLKLPNHRQKSILPKGHTKLSPRYYGPYMVLAKVGQVAYKLQLPEDSQIHPVFHVSSLKKFNGGQFPIYTLPQTPLEEDQTSPITTSGKQKNRGKLALLEEFSPTETPGNETTKTADRSVPEDSHDVQGGADVRGCIQALNQATNQESNQANPENSSRSYQQESSTNPAAGKERTYQRFTHGKFKK